MITKETFKEAIKEAFLKRDLTASLYHAGDPRILQTLEAQAQMLAMFSQQIEVAMQEPFVKSRDATVLADAALKGLIFTAKPVTVVLKVINNLPRTIKLSTGRYFIDATGRYYRLLEPVTLLGNAEGELKAIQLRTELQRHTVEDSYPFYAVEVDKAKDGSFMSEIQVKLNDKLLTPSYKFNGVLPDEPVFHVESDEYRRLYIKFGEDGVIGVQPAQGDVITIEKQLTFGAIVPELGSPFSLQEILTNDEQELSFEMKALAVAGSDVVDIATLRELCRYPAIYDSNAVFLGEFDMLLRRHFHNLSFLAVWNEQQEEKVRGANVENVNTLFVSFTLPPQSETNNKYAIQSQMRDILLKADDSYKVKFVEPVIDKIQCHISGSISSIYDKDRVVIQIMELLLDKYGDGSFANKQGKVVVRHKDISALLINNIQALNDQRSDLNVSIAIPTNNNPEVYRYMDRDSIQIQLTTEQYENSIWGG